MKNQVRGSILIILSAFGYATYGVWSRMMAGTFGEFNQAWTRGLALLIILVPWQLYRKSFKKIKRKDAIWFIVLSLLGGLNQAPYFYGFEHLTIGTATLLFYISLVGATFVIGKIFFKEELTMIKYSSLGTATIGLFIIYNFALTPEQILPATLTMLAGFMGGTFVSLSKKLSGNYSEVQIMTCDFAAMFIFNFVISGIVGEGAIKFESVMPFIGQAGYTVAILVANIFVIAGFRYLEPSVGGLLGLLEVVFAAVFGILIFKDILSTELLIGSVLIIIGAGLPDGRELVSKFYKYSINKAYRGSRR